VHITNSEESFNSYTRNNWGGENIKKSKLHRVKTLKLGIKKLNLQHGTGGNLLKEGMYKGNSIHLTLVVKAEVGGFEGNTSLGKRTRPSSNRKRATLLSLKMSRLKR